ncbi:MAG: hypothetical protein ISR77_27535 [Pirellulaceae bacterium]|nr:hypothetical protein [Pirellulaceae bacterium]
MSDIERRIERLERTNRRWRRVAGVLGAMLLLVCISGGTSPENVPDVVQAKRIEVLGPDGKPAIVLSAEDRQSLLRILARGQNHERSITLGADREGAHLSLAKHAEAPLFSVRVDDDGASLALYDGREPSQDPQGVILRSACPTTKGPGGTVVALTRGWGKGVESGLFMEEPQRPPFLLLSGPNGKKIIIRADQDTGKVNIVDTDG